MCEAQAGVLLPGLRQVCVIVAELRGIPLQPDIRMEQ